ncbi:ABC transporter substrate-binding protein [Dactylosporangium vinaceum]|uniref:ABC transporter substrate-binding protein n=1 Tax=Dactylosporangium vinaceum TaxID=53362 RepID=A0ABV5ME26_9ACTN|nr:ABC transporter substrate-binding protein [Dactylosporangium vinaceum]
MRSVTLLLAAGLAGVLAAAAGCAPSDESDTAAPAASGSGGPATSCAPAQLKTVAAGRLTVGTDDPVYPPWFADNKPESGEGFEAAVAYAVAGKLGYTKDQVTWTRVTFNNAIAPGPKAFDFDINEFSITEERKQAVDFSSPYYDVTQTVIALKSSKIAGAKRIADLKDAKLGAQVGTTSYRSITEVVKPSAGPAVYNNNDDAKKALQNGQIDGLVVDLPTAFYITGAEITDAAIIGQLPPTTGTPEQFGLVLDKGSRLTGCVSGAVDALRTDGTLQRLQQQWLSAAQGAPTLA